MSDDSTRRDAPTDDDIDVGEPVSVLGDFVEPTRKGFLRRLRNKIERRSLTAQVTSLGWELPRVLILELLDFVFYLVGPRGNKKGGSR